MRGMVCLTDSVWAEAWATWAATALPEGHFAPRGPVFSLYAVAVQEGLNGAGSLLAPFDTVATVPEPLVAWAQPGARQGQPVASVLHNLSAVA